MRLTRERDEYECRIASCFAEEWIEKVTGITVYNWSSDGIICNSCPFKSLVNKLAEFEDKEGEK